MKSKTPRMNFAADVGNWWRSLTFSQISDVHRWLKSNPPSVDWRGTMIEWAYLEMPVPEGW